MQYLIETVYILFNYSLNTEINLTFIRLTSLLHAFHSCQVTLFKSGTPADAGFQCSLYFSKCLLKQGYALKNISRAGMLFCVNGNKRKI